VVEIHPWAMHAAVDANCLASQNNDAYWDFADTIHASQREVNSEKTLADRLDAVDRLASSQAENHHLDEIRLRACVKAQDETSVKASMKEAEAVGVGATPTLFINGERFDGAVPIGKLRTALDNALGDLNLPAPEHAATVVTPRSN
jgi:protein-disulfide isomerase